MPLSPFNEPLKSGRPAGLAHKRASGWGLLVRAFRDTLFPAGCLGCGQTIHAPAFFCPACASEIQFLPRDGCQIRGRPLRGETKADQVCASCRSELPDLDLALALAVYQGPLGEAVRRFKYRRHWATGAALARLLAQGVPPAWLKRFEVLAPVPLHPRRLLLRGFNQAAVLGREVARQNRLSLVPRLLRRLRHTRPQVGLNPSARRANVAGAFALVPGEEQKAQGAGVLVVDDVFTTGATANECARVLKQAGAARVGILTLVRAASGDLLADRPPEGYDRMQKEGAS